MAFHPQPKSAPSAITRHRKRVDETQALKDAYSDVDRRDAGVCWVTGRHTAKYGTERAVDPRIRREHHHLKGRNVKPEWVYDPHRIITVCREAHALITAGWIVVEGTDARKPIFFHYADFVKAHQKPFRIREKSRVRRDV